MASVYGSSLDAIQQAELAQQNADEVRRNNYGNRMNQFANTNLRRREGDSMDRFRTGDIDVRRLDASSMGDYRRGIISNDANRIGAQERINDRTMTAQERAAAMGLEGQKYGSDNTVKLGTLQSNNLYNLGLDTNRTAVTNVGRQAQAQEGVALTAAEAAKFGSGAAATAAMYGADANARIASIPYKMLTARERAIVDANGVDALMPQDANVRAIQAAAQTERDAADRSAYQTLLGEIDSQYKSDNTGFFSFINPNNDSTKAVNQEINNIAAQRNLTTDDQKASVYDEAIGNVARRMSAARQPGFNIQSMGGTNAAPGRPAPLTQRKTRSGIVYEE
jgi:hypothetical protein